MWRNSLNSSSRLLLSPTNPNPKPFLSSLSLPSSYLYSLIRTGASSPSSSSSAGPVNPGFHRSNALPAFRFAPESTYPGFGSPSALPSLRFGSSVTSLPLPAASASNARDVLDLARHYGRCYWELSKAKLSVLVVATSGAGFVLGSVNAVDVPGLCLTCAGTMMAAASANSLNQVFEIDNDAKMKRTRLRPLPSGRITVPHAIAWASSMGLAGTTLLACKANVLAAGLAASNIVLYAFVYTPLKQIHPVNTWVGAVVGAVPPLLGWAAASGDVSLNAWILPAALYFWQIPHFMALAYLCRDDYAAGGFRMFSLADAYGHRTALVALRNCIYLAPLGFLTYHLGVASGWFCLESSLLALAMTAAAFKFWRSRTAANARRMFHASLLYLPAFMSGLLFHRLSVNEHSSLIENNAETICNEFSHFSITSAPESEYVGGTRSLTSPEARPPVAFASVAPFPFLPAPCYATF